MECGAVLDAPVDENTEYETERNRRRKISDLSEHSDAFNIGKLNIAYIVINALVIIASVIILILIADNRVFVSNPPVLAVYILSSSVVLLYSAFPRVVWFFNSLRMRMYTGATDLQPSFFYVFVTKVICGIITLACVVGILTILTEILL